MKHQYNLIMSYIIIYQSQKYKYFYFGYFS